MKVKTSYTLEDGHVGHVLLSPDCIMKHQVDSLFLNIHGNALPLSVATTTGHVTSPLTSSFLQLN
jgi:hypothetical protein